MEKIVKTYGRFFLAGSVVALLMVMIFFRITDNEGRVGALNIIGEQIRTEDFRYHDYTDYDMYLANAAREKPTIHYSGSNSIRVGNVTLSDYIYAKNYNGQPLTIKVENVIDPQGTEVLCDENFKVNCSIPGIYVVTVSAVDDINKKTVSAIRVPVNH